jgi:hypothetical protein
MLGESTLLAHPDPAKRICVFTDASNDHWGAVISQISVQCVDLLVADQDHVPLMFVSGTFSGAASRWAIVEKEAFAILETLRRADYLLHRPGGFDLYTDHSNLKFIFNPASLKAAVPKYTAAKLDRWALLLMGYDYRIKDIAGDDNVWADLLSRWGRVRNVCAIFRVPLKISPLMDKEFVWPTVDEVQRIQEVYVEKHGHPDDVKPPVAVSDGVLRCTDGALWIPPDAAELQVRLCVIAHFGLAGHRGYDTTLDRLKPFCWWHNMANDVKYFVSRCLHCASTQGTLKRPYGEALHASKPNEILHWDFLSLPAGYLLVMKDDASKYVLLWEAEVATSAVVVRGLLHWFSLFGIARTWVTDQGSHFKNEVIADLQHCLGAQHHFTTARCPWANGTIENAVKQVIRVFQSV